MCQNFGHYASVGNRTIERKIKSFCQPRGLFFVILVSDYHAGFNCCVSGFVFISCNPKQMASIWSCLGVMGPLWRQGKMRSLSFYGPKRKSSFVAPVVYCSHDGSLPKQSQLGYDLSEEILGLQVDLKSRNVMSGSPKLRSWFGPNGQYIRELPCPSCRGRGYSPCTECGIERSRLDCAQCSGKGIMTCRQCLGDCVTWEESIDEKPWEKARSISPVKVQEDDEVDNLDINLDKKEKSKRVYQSLPPEVGVKISRSLKSLNAKTGLFSKRMKIIHRDPILRAQRVAAIKKARGTAAARKCTSEALRAFFSDPENRHKRSIAMKGVKFYCKNCGREGHRKYYCPELDDGLSDRRFTCRLCGEKGHNRRTCLKSRTSHHKGRSMQQNRCSLCHQSGHNRRTCPRVIASKISRGDTKKGQVCQFCGQRGHNRRTCPATNSQPATITIQHEEKGSKHVID